MTKTFSYEEGRLSYAVTVYEDNGEVFATIKVLDGSMDVNAVYVADDHFSGKSVNLNGPLNMSGGGSRFGEQSIQWDSAITLSSPGLGPEGKNKETFLTEGQELTVKLDVSSMEDVDFIGIRATSTSTKSGNEGSIKAVLGDPVKDEDPKDPEDPCEPGNRPPVAVKDIFETEFDTTFTGNVLVNDTDPDGDELSVLTNTQPANGKVTMNPDGTFTYTPNAGFIGEDSFSYTVIDGNGGYDQTTVHITVPCFAAGTLIVTAEGPKPVEEIRIGDKVLTRDDGFQPVRWAGRRVLDAGYLAQNPDFTSVLITAGALGNKLPRRDLRVSPGHRMLLSGYQAEMMFGEREVLVAASDLVGQPGITYDPSPVTYVHVMFDSHQIIDSEGAWSESFQPADVTLNGLDSTQRDELLALFPELATGKGQRSYATARRVLARHESSALLAM